MAYLLQGINGPFSGKVGQVIGFVWKGRPLVRGYRKHISYPNTPEQQEERDWFIAMVRFASSARAALKIGFATCADAAHMTEGNFFVRENKQHFQMEEGSLSIDYSRLTISRGSAADVYFKPARFEEGEVVSVDFEKNAMSLRASGEDHVYLFAYCPDLKQSKLSAPALRRNRRVRVSLPSNWAGLDVHLYGFVQDRDGRVSNSTYIGTGRVNHYEDSGRYVEINKGWLDFVDIVNQTSGSKASASAMRNSLSAMASTSQNAVQEDAPKGSKLTERGSPHVPLDGD